MIVLLIALFCLFFLITIRDVRYRLVYGEDLLMLAACCLFVGAGNLDCYVLFVALMGIVLALVWLFAKKSKTFPFAPALVWPCWLLLVL